MDRQRPHASTAPSPAFVGTSWAALGLGALGFLVGLWTLGMPLHEKGYYLAVLLHGLFAAISVQKAVRDRAEGVPVTGLYHGLAWFSVLSALALLGVGLWNATIAYSARGFLAMAYALALFAAIAVQKNTRDAAAAGITGEAEPQPFWRRAAQPGAEAG